MAVAAIVLLVLVTGYETVRRTARLPGPIQSVRLLTAEPSDHPDLFATELIPGSSDPTAWDRLGPDTSLPDVQVPWEGEQLTAAEFLDRTSTNALIVVVDGEIAVEWYRDGIGPDTLLPSFSVAKSVVGLLIGQEIDAGRLTESDRVGDLVPWLAQGDRYDDITVGQLLDMTSAIDVSEDYETFLSPVARMYITTDLEWFLRGHRAQYAEPGQWDYRSVDTAVLGAILTELNGMSLPELVAARLWQPLGATSNATWSLDRDGGRAKAFCCLNATATDFARIGQLVLDRGLVDDRRVVSDAWIERSSDRRLELGGGWAYSAQWWLPRPGTIMANGIHGQYVVVDPAQNTVVVKLSDDELGRDDLQILRALDAIVSAAGPS